MTLHFIKAALGIVCLICSALHALPIDLPEIPLVEDVPILENVTKLENVPIVEDLEFIANYLLQYGYIKTLVTESLNLEALAEPISEFQEFVGLNVTGATNKETIAKMKAPRCGVKDIIDNAEDAIRRRKRFDAIVKWEKNGLTYRLNKLPKRIQDETQVRQVMTKSLKMWSDVSKLSFREERTAGVNVDIDIGFLIPSKKYDPSRGNFGKIGGVLAVAYLPYKSESFKGDAFFDDAEIWTINEKRDTVMIQVAVHEFGHSLGLGHSNTKSAVMYPFYAGYNPNYRLDEDDIKGIQKLYEPHSDVAPDLCKDASFDTIARTKDGNTYVFKGEWYWQIKDRAIGEGYPKKISDDWKGLEGNLDSSLAGDNGKTYFYKGGRQWVFINQQKDSGPHPVANDVPDFMDSALTWIANGEIYYFKADIYWQYKGKGYPRLITTHWRGLPDGIDAAFTGEDSRTYFFRGEKYYLYDDSADAVAKADPPYPRSTAKEWFSCPNTGS